MSIDLQGSNHSWIPLLTDKQYSPLDEIIISYLGREVISLTNPTSFCSAHSVVLAASRQFVNEDQACIDEGFPQSLMTIFHENTLSLWRIPTLNATVDLDTDTIQQNMLVNFSICRCRDRKNRPFLVLHIVELSSKAQGIIVIFKRYTTPDDHTWQARAILSGIKYTFDFKTATHYFETVKSMIENTHPKYKITNEVPQITPSLTSISKATFKEISKPPSDKNLV